MRALLILVVFLVSCNREPKDEGILISEESTADAIESLLDNPVLLQAKFQDTLVDRSFIEDLYSLNEYEPFWFKRKKLSEAADTLIMFLSKAELFGLNPSYYHVTELKKALDRKQNDEQKAIYDIMLTDAFCRFFTEIHSGKLDPRTKKAVYKGVDLRYYLRSLIIYVSGKNKVSRIVHAFEPPHPLYRNLKESLFQLVSLRNKLYKVGTDGNSPDSTMIENAMGRFIVLNEDLPGIFPDPDSVKRISDKIQYLKKNLEMQESYIRMNLEKWRWEKRTFGPKFVFLNIASYQVYYFESDHIVFNSKVVVGKPDSPTPELESAINSVLVFPKWHVPYSIASKEILPLVQKNIEYLYSQNMEVLDKEGNIVDPGDIDWSEHDEKNLPFLFRQREGEANALGVLKFHFPNRYGVYMHDTNDKRLFKKKFRAYSHGCMRVEKPREFAGILLRRSDSIAPEIDSYISKRQHRNLSLEKPVPVFIKYFTAESVNDTLRIYPDIYNKDEQTLKFFSL